MDKFGRFRIDQVQRRAGRRASYLVRDPDRSGQVLLRLFSLKTPDVVARVERVRELSKALGAAAEGRFVPFLEAGAVGDKAYLTRPFVEGVTLQHLLDRGLSVEEALHVFAQLCGAVRSAHEVGVVHGNLHPGNVVVSPTGAVEVVDAGLQFGRRVRERHDLAALGRVGEKMIVATSGGLDGARIAEFERIVGHPLVFSAAEREFRGVSRMRARTAEASAPESAGTSAPPVRARVVNTWFDGDEPFPPLRAGVGCRFHLNIGRRRDDVAAGSTDFREPDFGRHSEVVLRVSFFSEDFEINARTHELVLKLTGDTPVVTSDVTPLHAGPCRLEVVLSLAKELDLLQQLRVDVDVAPAAAPAEAAYA